MSGILSCHSCELSIQYSSYKANGVKSFSGSIVCTKVLIKNKTNAFNPGAMIPKLVFITLIKMVKSSPSDPEYTDNIPLSGLNQ